MLKLLNSKKNPYKLVLMRTANLMSHVVCNLVIPARPESFFRKDSRQAGVTDLGYFHIKKAIYFIVLFSLFMLIYTPSFADYKIILKNGREFVVDDYKDMGGKIKFYREGGEIELDKTIIKDIKKTKAVKRAEESSALETTKDTPEKPAAEKSAQPQKQEIDSKLKEIAGKKAQLTTEGEKLIADKKKLEEDIRKKGRVSAIREKRDIEKQISELETKIKKFNEEISSLDMEQEKLLKEAGQ